MPCHFMWRIFYFLQLARLPESLEYCDEAVWFPCEAELETNMGQKTGYDSRDVGSRTNGSMAEIDRITLGNFIWTP